MGWQILLKVQLQGIWKWSISGMLQLYSCSRSSWYRGIYIQTCGQHTIKFPTSRSNVSTVSTHNTVNLSVTFVDPATGTHPQNRVLDSYWKHCKTKLNGVPLPSYLDEFMWRREMVVLRHQHIIIILTDIAIQYPLSQPQPLPFLLVFSLILGSSPPPFPSFILGSSPLPFLSSLFPSPSPFLLASPLFHLDSPFCIPLV